MLVGRIIIKITLEEEMKGMGEISPCTGVRVRFEGPQGHSIPKRPCTQEIISK